MINDQLKKTRQTWSDMKSRCFNPKSQQFKNYGDRGITVCARWKDSFEFFLEDMGLKPYGLTLDRINNDGNYEPNNCRWATKWEQRLNQRTCNYLEYQGLRLTMREWALRLGINEQTMHGRIRQRGWSVEKALSTPVNEKLSAYAKKGMNVRWHAAIAKGKAL